MEEIPIAAGLQIINAEVVANGARRYWRSEDASFDSVRVIEDAFSKLIKK